LPGKDHTSVSFGWAKHPPVKRAAERIDPAVKGIERRVKACVNGG
jgi:hypothetical protein